MARHPGARRSTGRAKRGPGRPPLHGIRMQAFAFRMPPSMREALGDLVKRSGVSTNDVLLVALHEWLATRPAPSHVSDVASRLDFALPRERT